VTVTPRPDDIKRARDALQAIPPDLPREDWVRAGMAAHAAGLGFDEFDAWSARAENYEPRAARDTWRSFKPGVGIGAGTLYRMAADHGHSKAPARPVAGLKPPRPGMGAAEVWGRFKPAPADHPYIVAKQGRADGLRAVPEGDPLRIAGESLAGWLVVPVRPLAGGEPTSLQFIPAPGAGKKLNLPGVPMAGTFIVGELAPGGTAYVCEGLATAWACWTATGHAAVVTFGAGRTRAVATELRQRDPNAQIVLVPDVGKEGEAETIALEVGAAVARMPEGWPLNADFNDLALRDGFDAVEALLATAVEPPKQAPRYRLLTGEDLRALPPLAWRVRGVLPAVGVAAIFGPSTSGKSFLGFDLGAHIAQGRDWFGHRVKPAPVVYVALEGEAGFRLRAQAWEQAHGRRLPDGLRLVLQGFKLTDPQDVLDLASAVLSAGDGAVTFLDTLNRAAPGADENASADMGRILEAAKALQGMTNGLVVLIHHSGKDAARGLRGHSSLFAALDAAVEVAREADRREWKVGKAKDGADGEAHPFRLEVVDLGDDDEGEPLTSCVVRPDESPEQLTRARLPKGGNQKIVLDALGDLLRKSSAFGRAGAPAPRPCVELEAAIESVAPRLTCEPVRRKERARQAITGLVASGVLCCRESWLWLP